MDKRLIVAILFIASFATGANAAYGDAVKEESLSIDSSVVGNYLSGDYAVRNQDAASASLSFSEALRKDPENPVLLKGGYRLMLSLGEIKKAVEIAIRYLNNNEMTSSLGVLLSAYEIKRSEFDRAGVILEQVTIENDSSIEAGVNSVITPMLRIWVKSGQGKYDEALAEIEQLQAEEKLPPTFLYYQSALIADLAGNIEVANKGYSEIIAREQIIPYHFAQMAGNFYMRSGNAGAAKELFTSYNKQRTEAEHFSSELKQIDKNNAASQPRLVKNAADGFSEVLKEAVRVLYSGGYFNEGLGYLRLSMFLAPDNDETTVLLAKYYENIGQYQPAIEQYEKIGSKSDFYLTSQVSIADNLYVVGERKKSVKLLKKLSRKNPDSTLILLSLADLLRKDGRYDDAAGAYSKMIDRISTPELKNWPMFFARGICFERAGKWQQAEADLLKSLELKPGQPEVLNYLGYSWIDRNMNIEQAKSMVEEAVKERPDDAQVIDSMGWVLFKTKDFENASKFLERAAEITPYDSVINNHLGDSYWKQGRYNEARFQWQRALKFKNSDEVLDDDLKEKLKNGLPDSPANAG